MSDWLVIASYFLHFVATAVWVGGIVLMAIVGYPGLRRALGVGPQSGAAIAELQRRLAPLYLLSLITLGLTGLIQMSVNSNYEGLLVFGNIWSIAILLKHIAFLIMSAITAYSAWSLSPTLSRLTLLESRGKAGGGELAALRNREERLNQLNVACALVILLFTAIARSV
jgi:putative copper export protein